MARVETFTLGCEPLTESPRRVWVCLPDSYDRTKKKYDVLYMFDGHNLFSDETATFGKSWGLKEYLEKTGLDLVIVGQDCNHTGTRRMDEYCPMEAEALYGHAQIDPAGDVTAEWFVNVLKKECEKRYRIFHDRRHVGIAGSSMGGLMAEYCVARYNDVFSKAACVSPAHYFCWNGLKKLINETDFKDTRIYLDLGSEERDTKKALVWSVASLLELSHLYEQKGCHTYPYLVVDGIHSESSWEKIVPVFLEYLWPELY